MLTVVHLLDRAVPGPLRDGVPMLEVPQLTVHNGHLSRAVPVAEYRDQQPAARPVDIVPSALLSRAAVAVLAATVLLLGVAPEILAGPILAAVP